MNYQKELDKFTKENRLDLCVIAFTSILENGSIFYSAGEKKNAIFAAVMCWNILVIILRLRYYIIIRTFFQKVNIRRESGNSRS